ncbi:MAG: CoA transferase [Chloroflexota bacterium]|nr:CoA transferase [Chloroflexota bacterium]
MSSKGVVVNQVFEGVKVADFSWVAVGPHIGRELAEHGATVVRVESHKRPDMLRTGPPFKGGITDVNHSAFGAAYNTCKYGISLDLNKPRSKEVAARLVKWADVITESMVPGTMAKWGLDYENCCKIKPDIVYLSTCQQGQYGPYAKLPGFGAFSALMGGYSFITGWPDRNPAVLWNNYTDFISCWYCAIAVIGALLHRKKTGKGTYIDLAQIEAGLTFLGPAALDYMASGRIPVRSGNHDTYMAPHNVYPSRGKDSWIAIAISSEEEWQSFCRVIGEPEWSKQGRFSTFITRKENEDELDGLIAGWTINYTAEQVMVMMQEKSVPAGMVEKGQDLFYDPQLKHREHLRFLQHTVIGRHAYNAPAYKLSKTPCYIWKAAPCLGEDNLYVYQDILGFSEDEISDLIVEGVITTEADVPESMKG